MAPVNYISITLPLIFLHFLLQNTNVFADSQPIFFLTTCEQNGNYTQNSTYQHNLYQVLQDLGTQAATTSFYNTSRGDPPDTVYGMFYCRADINRPLCLACVRAAARQVVNVNCTSEKDAIIWYEECTLRYAQRPVTSFNENNEGIGALTDTTTNVSNPDQFVPVLGNTMTNLITKVAYNICYQGYATKEETFPPDNSTLYSLVQCTPDIFGLECDRCLRGILRYLLTEYRGLMPMTYFRPNCQIRYDTAPFYTPLPSPLGCTTPPSPSRRRVLFYITRVVVPAVGFVLLLFCVIAICLYRRKKMQQKPTGKGPELEDGGGDDLGVQHSTSSESLKYSLETIKYATGNFAIENKLGQGGFGAVYKGRLPDGQEIAVKRLAEDSRQGLKEFTNEVMLVAKLQHRNLVKLLGFCLEGQEKLLVYEFVSNLSLDRFLFDPNRRRYLDWETRFKIIIGIARGLLYLHEDSRVKIIHRDLKISNILLDDEMNPKIADFGMARLMKINHTQANTSKIFGTFGYMAPEYAAAGVFSIKSDVYSFGVMLLEIISGQSNNLVTRSLGKDSLINHAWKCWNTGTIMELVDPSLGNNISRAEVLRCIQVALFCVQEEPSSRPTMESVLFILQNNSSDVHLTSRLSAISSEMNARGEHITGEEDQFESLESNQPYNRNSTQFTDLYPR